VELTLRGTKKTDKKEGGQGTKKVSKSTAGTRWVTIYDQRSLRCHSGYMEMDQVGKLGHTVQI
jgi:hypothetical protein